MSVTPRRRRPAWLESFLNFWDEFKRSKTGMTGLALIILFSIVALAFPLVGNQEDIDNWFNAEYWVNKLTPQLAPPVWVNWFSSQKYPETSDLEIKTIKLIEFKNINESNKQLLSLIKLVEPSTYEKLEKAIKRIEELAKKGVISEKRKEQMLSMILKNVRRAIVSTYGDHVVVEAFIMPYEYTADLPPNDIAIRGYIGPEPPGLKIAGVLFAIVRPDGIIVPLASVDRKSVEGMVGIVLAGGCGNLTAANTSLLRACGTLLTVENYMPLIGDKALETLSYYSIPPLKGMNNTRVWVFRLSQLQSALVKAGAAATLENILKPFLEQLNATINPRSPPRVDKVTFLSVEPGMLEGEAPSLKGRYDIVIIVLFAAAKPMKQLPFNITTARVMGVYGLLGTDDMGRDLWQGVLYGVRWALIIGLLTSILSTLIGVLYGTVSGYFGGFVDAVMNRAAQVVYSLPVLPLLILLSYYIGKSIWNIVLLLVAFGWVGLVFTVRSMALQLRESLYVEAARALGASNSRIIFRYIFPQVLPYTFASIALGVPGAILTEAGLSFLGLGDPSIVTWGKILHDAQMASAVLNNAWWWVVPPGLAIALVGMSFVFLGYTLDAILNPRLRR